MAGPRTHPGSEAGAPGGGGSLRVLFVSEFFAPAWSTGGTVTAGWNLTRALARAGARVQVVTTDAHTGPRGIVPRTRTEESVAITTARVWRWGGRWTHRYGIAPGIVRDLSRVGADAQVCVMQGLWTFPVAAASRLCAQRGMPYVLCAHGALDRDALAAKALKKRIYSRMVAEGIIRRAAVVHFSSNREMERSRTAIGDTRAIVIPNGFAFPARERRRGQDLRAALRLPPDAFLVGMSGRIHPGKGVDILVSALAHCAPRVHAVVFGSDHERHLPAIVRLARASGVQERVHHLGHLDPPELQRTYAAIDALAVPSRGESFGNVVVEALVQGTPVIVSREVPLADDIAREAMGVVVESLEPAAWGAAIETFVSTTRSFDGDRAARLVAEAYDLDIVGGRWMELLSEITRERPDRVAR